MVGRLLKEISNAKLFKPTCNGRDESLSCTAEIFGCQGQLLRVSSFVANHSKLERVLSILEALQLLHARTALCGAQPATWEVADPQDNF